MSRKFALFMVACVLIFGAMVLAYLPVLAGQIQTSTRPATDYVVNSLGDTADGSCDVTHCSLREAISQANMDTDANTIIFSVSGTIGLTSTLPAISGTLIIDGGHAITIDGASAIQVMRVNSGAALTLSALTLANGASDTGGGIDNEGTLTVTNSTLIGNYAHVDGGGIFNGGTLTVIDSLFSGNMSNLELFDPTIHGGGGGVYNSGALTIVNSTFTGNYARGQTFGYSGNGDGGGGIFSDGALTITNSTFDGNYVTGNIFRYCCPGTFVVYGGGISNQGALTVTNSTFAGNSAAMFCGNLINSSNALAGTASWLPGIGPDNPIPIPCECPPQGCDSYGGGIYNTGKVTLRNTIVANSPAGGNCDGGVTNGGNNLDSSTSCGWGASDGSLSNTDPQLARLADNGGPAPTMRLWPGSPAIDGVTFNAPNNCPATDQRGVTRPIGPRCDIGAYEASTPFRFYLSLVARAAP